jgi:hypothetical protein
MPDLVLQLDGIGVVWGQCASRPGGALAAHLGYRHVRLPVPQKTWARSAAVTP